MFRVISGFNGDKSLSWDGSSMAFFNLAGVYRKQIKLCLKKALMPPSLPLFPKN